MSDAMLFGGNANDLVFAQLLWIDNLDISLLGAVQQAPVGGVQLKQLLDTVVCGGETERQQLLAAIYIYSINCTLYLHLHTCTKFRLQPDLTLRQVFGFVNYSKITL